MKAQSFFERLAHWLSRSQGVKNQSYNEALILLAAIFATAPLMWSYTLNSYFTVPNIYHLHPLAFVYSFVHTSSLLIYRYRPSLILVTNIFIGAGLLFQLHHSTVTGGFFSTTVIWLTILPLIVGVVSSVRHMMFWALMVTIGLIIEFMITSYGLSTDQINEFGRIWGQLNIVFGYGFINICLIYAYKDRELRAMMKLEAKQKKIKSLFRILIHDLSNPLTLIMFSKEALEKKPSEEDQKIFLDRIEKSCQTIESIISSTKAFEKSSQQKSFKLGRVNLKECLDECLEILRIKIEMKNLKVDLNIPPDLFVLAQATALTHQVLMNIVSNAIKFSLPESTIQIEAWREDGQVILKVQDHGVGMSKQTLKHLFDEGANTSTMGTSGERGSGFGMPIASMTMKRLHGQIRVESSQEEGSCGTVFTLTFETVDD